MSFKRLLDGIDEGYRKDLSERAAKLGITPEELERREKAEHEEKMRPIREAEEKRKLERETQVAKDRQAFIEKVGIQGAPAIIMRWRMLGENSVGDGATRKTVIHLHLDEDFTQGRIKRNKGDLLCGRKGRFDINRQDYALHNVTCPVCLKFIEKGKKNV